jgi:hypothetical protein
LPAITKSLVSSAKAESKDRFIWDDDVHGFGLKVTPAGGKSYVLTFRLGDNKPRMKIGDHGAWTPQAAREEAKRLRRLVDQGIDPRNEKRQRQEDRVNLEISAYIERFIEQYLVRHWSGAGYRDAAALLRKRVAPRWKGRHLKEIARSDVAHFINAIEGGGARRMHFAVLRKMFKWAVSNGDIAESPMRDMESPPTLPSRDRVLADEELALCWNAAAELGEPFGSYVRMLAITGQRRDEVAKMQWQELTDAIRDSLLGKSEFLPSGDETLDEASIALVMKSFGHPVAPNQGAGIDAQLGYNELLLVRGGDGTTCFFTRRREVGLEWERSR